LGLARWRISRAWTIEAASLTHEQNRLAETNGSDDPPTQTMLAFRSLADNDLMGRNEHRFDRQHCRALEALTKREDRKIATRSQFFEDNKGQPKGAGASQPPVEPNKTTLEPMPDPLEPIR
jgi:hypothetical protein